MKIGIGSDHAGFRYKEQIKEFLAAQGHSVRDFGTDSETSVDYPLFIRPVAEAVARGEVERGIVLGGSGNGEAMAANRVAGVRCALCWDVVSARFARAHNDANMISMGQRMLSIEMAFEIVRTWLSAPFEGGRHVRRIQQLGSLALLWSAAIVGGSLSVAPARAQDAREMFEARLVTLDARDVVGHLALARWCAENRLEEERRQMLLHVLAIDPAQEEAYKGLGYVFRDGVWVSSEDERRELGWVLYKGKWLPPRDYRPARIADWIQEASGKDEAAALQAAEALAAFVCDEDLSVLRSLLKRRQPERARGALRKGLCRLEGAQALEFLAAKLVDPKDEDAEALLSVLKEGSRPSLWPVLATALKPYLARKAKLPAERVSGIVEALEKSSGNEGGDEKGKEAGRLLYRFSIQAPHAQVRSSAGKALAARRDPEILDAVLKLLAVNSTLLRERASHLAELLNDPRAIPALVDSLEATLASRARAQEAARPDHPLGFVGSGIYTGDGGGRSPFGLNDFLLDPGETVPMFDFAKIAQEAVALQQITGEKHGEDVRAWRRWLAAHPSK